MVRFQINHAQRFEYQCVSGMHHHQTTTSSIYKNMKATVSNQKATMNFWILQGEIQNTSLEVMFSMVVSCLKEIKVN